MRNLLKSIFTEYSVQLWSKITAKNDVQDAQIDILNDKVTNIEQNGGGIKIGDALDTATPTPIFFKVIG